MKVVFEGDTLRLVEGGTIAVSATRNFANRWRWHSSITGRAGKNHHHITMEGALRAGAKQLGLEIVGGVAEGIAA